MKGLDLYKGLYRNSGEKVVIANEQFISMWKSHDYLPDIIPKVLLEKAYNGADSINSNKTFVFKFTDSYTIKAFPIMEDQKVVGYILTFLDTEDVEAILCQSIHHKYQRKTLNDERISLMPLLNDAADYYFKGKDIPKEHFMKTQKNIAKLLSKNINSLQISKYYTNEISSKLISVTQTLEDLSDRLKKEFVAENLNLTCDIEKGIFAKIDASCLTSSIVNLIINGYIYNNNDKKEILLKAFSDDKNITIEVWDNGTSADINKMENAKIPFNGLDLSSKGECLGLSLVNKFAEYFNGSLSFLKDQNGLTVRITLPNNHETPTSFASKKAIFPSNSYFDTVTCLIAKAD